MINNKILYIGGFELPDKNAAAQRVIANGKVFEELGYKVFYLTPDRALTDGFCLKKEPGSFEGFTFYRTKYPAKIHQWFTHLFRIKDVVELTDELKNVAFIVAYNYPAPALSRLSRLCKKRRIGLIADCTEWYEPRGNIIYKNIKQIDTYLRMKVLHPKLDGVIAISKYLYDFYHARMANVIQVPPLVDAKSAKWKSLHINQSDGLLLVYAGSPGKGAKDRIDSIVKVLSRIRTTTKIKFSLHVIGLSRLQYIDDFGDNHLPEEMDTGIVFKGRLSHNDTLNEVKSADYAIFIRDNNLVNTAGFPTKFVEALSCGTPVLSNTFSNISDYIQEGVNGYKLDDSTEETLVKTLTKSLSQGKEKIREMKLKISEDNIFDYRKYTVSVHAFLINIQGNLKNNGK